MPSRSRSTLLILAAATLVLGGCLRRYQPAKPGSVLDTTCEGATEPGADWVAWRIPEASFAAPPSWRLERNDVTEVSLRRIDGELTVWSGSRWIFPLAEPWQSVRCTIARGGDTTFTVQTTRIAGRIAYRVDVVVQPLIEGRHVYLQMQTPYLEHLRDVRAILTSMRFGPADTAGIAKRPREGR